ncbi:hypothetical protein ID866_10443 [Astraeus odoratus]|nr:hypothetical protein ID866_10443 [Astraeus odoratus]
MKDPNLAELPNFAALEFQEDCQHFLDAGLMDWQVVDALQRQQGHLQEAEEARKRDAIHQQQLEEEEAQILYKECKKNKAKFVPIPDMEVVAEPIILPSQAMLHKLQQHRFCELWYFTNEGLHEATVTCSFALDNDTFSFLPTSNGTMALVLTSMAQDKANIIEDENLSFKQFSQATLHMISFMQDTGWDQPHVQMHIQFWSTIENHKWHNTTNPKQQCALLTYQGNL